MRCIALLFVCALAACGQASSLGSSGSIVPAALTPAKVKGPAFTVVTVLPDAVRPHANGEATTASLRAVTYVGKKRYVDVTSAGPAGCTLSDTSGTIGGCEVAYEGTASYAIKHSTFAFYAKPNGKGCVVAEGTYKGTIDYNGQILAITFKQKNASKCW